MPVNSFPTYKEHIMRAADYAAGKLVEHGCLVYRYDAVSTSSVYLKVDAGAACSIRFSDHASTRHLKYRFNYMVNVPGNQVEHTEDGYGRLYYPAGALDRLIGDVVELRRQRRVLYFNYDALVEQSIAEGRELRGFWQKAYCVNDMKVFKHAA